ncbi:acetolactate synthase [Tuber brumale]|nr:acetolactate synthase [Tuber brumale]
MSGPASLKLSMYTASFAFFEALWEAGVTHCFVNLGSDHPSILEAIVKGKREKPHSFPELLTCPNEMVALSAAHGMAQVTGKPQAVIVHVDVGTQGLGAAVHNASCSRVPVLIFAGLSPFTQEGEMRGSRTEFIHYIQDVPDQKAIVAQYCRYSAEIKTGKNIKQMVNRAMSFAMSDPKGPVYLTAAREVLEEDIEPYSLNQAVWDPIGPTALTEDAVSRISQSLLSAENPLVITGYSGRNKYAVEELITLADSVPGLRVLDTLGSDMCFPANHRSSLGVMYGSHEKITMADVILVIDCDVPWIPTQCRPSPRAEVYHIDIDPLKQQMPLFYIDADARYRADAYTALKQINSHTAIMRMDVATRDARIQVLDNEHKVRMDRLEQQAKPRDDGLLSCAHVMKFLRGAIPQDSVIILEAVTQTVTVVDQMKCSLPKTIFNSGAGGLGWFGGAALGAKLALDNGTPNSGPFVVAIVGDGTFLFSVPASVYWISRRYRIPFLTIVINNDGWNAPLRSAKLVHPDGLSAHATAEELNISFKPSPDYAGIAVAAAGGEIWGGKAEKVEQLASVLEEAIGVVKGGRSAVVEVVIV